jgi:hypothetical protein
MISKTSQAYLQIDKHKDLLLNGIVLSIDPSIGSQSSLPGWAVFEKGELIDSGVMEVPREGDHPVRLWHVRHEMEGLRHYYKPDIVVIENIPSAAGRFNLVALASLHMARGAILSCVGLLPWVTILPQQWTKLTRSTYIKGDANDAVEFGYITIELAKRMAEDKPVKKRKYGEAKSKPLQNRRCRKTALPPTGRRHDKRVVKQPLRG